MKINNFFYLTILSVLANISLYITSNYILTVDVLYNSFSGQLVKEQLLKLVETRERFNWLQYVFSPLVILFRSTIVASCLNMGIFIYFNENEISFNKLFRITLLGEFIFIIGDYFKALYFLFIKNDYLIIDFQRFYPFSVINFLEDNDLQLWFVYPLQLLSLFELIYWFILAYLLGKQLGVSTKKSFIIVASSYGVALLIWVGAVMYLTLNLS